MLAALIEEIGTPTTIDVHSFTQDFLMAFNGDERVLDTSKCFKSSVAIEEAINATEPIENPDDETITEYIGIANLMAPHLSTEILAEIFDEDRNFDMMASRIATGMFFLADLMPDISKAYEDCEDEKLQEDI